ncbi:MAG: hypothetical protein A2Y62_05110 [Candidatus Fischerbacteria bacterium RBG_13_37_8]|uniref:Carbamoyltransferase n=1 Tax=Candidatus Fischerbacteria bacterium RBG_13_37_8 TaxID=1817863 RepID=A0A1F5V8J2_9BACT|nr:MAG: hypothetical protein A2Y62_05110 [Candidatus Fischerbacteria bacterium RBG_13_37_8]
MYILGLNAFTHDASAALLCDGKIIAYAQEERFTRLKHDPSFPWNSIQYCLNEAHISLKEITVAAFSWSPFHKLIPRFLKTFYNIGGGIPRLKSQGSKWLDIINVKGILEKHGFEGKFYYVPHHNAHAAACFYSSSFLESAILVIDGVGEHATTSLYHGKANSINLLQQYYYPDSLGLFYAAITEYLGFKNNDGEGKVMGLAPYGLPEYYNKMKDCLFLNQNNYKIDTSYFDFAHRWFTKKFEKEFGPARIENEPITEHHYNIAASAQKILEEKIWHFCQELKRITQSDNLCYTGGVSLNCQANHFIWSRKDFKTYYFFPAAYDAGTSLGAALFAFKDILNCSDAYSFEHVFWGPAVEKKHGALLAQQYSLHVQESNNLYEQIARIIAHGKIVGWCMGKTEIGPRALGNRSILADPRKPEIKDIVNNKIKKREPFRPFAPTILAEKAPEYFHTKEPSPYMMMTLPIAPEKINEVPSVVHVDGTCRVQTLERQFNEPYYQLITEFHALTNVPMILNTSFNKAGEPLVSNEQDSILSFINSDLDVLVLAGLIITK